LAADAGPRDKPMIAAVVVRTFDIANLL